MAALLATGAQVAAQPPADSAAPVIARVLARNGAALKVASDGWSSGGDIPFEFTQYRGNHFPGFSWSQGPEGTQSYALIMQDTDLVIRGGPVLHWVMFNIPPNVTRLDPSMTTPPAGSGYGPNYKGVAQAYLGPRTPAGPKHHYHVQVFALEVRAPEAAASSLPALIDAMQGHVLASGEVVGLAERDPMAPPH